MKAALSRIAFSSSSDLEGAIALLETALDALERAECHLACAYVDHALTLVRADAAGGLSGLLENQ